MKMSAFRGEIPKTVTMRDIYAARFPDSIWAIHEPFLSSPPLQFGVGEKASYSVSSDGTATIKIDGVILQKESDCTFRDEISQENILENINAAMADDAVSAIRLSVDSPGGVAQGILELADHIRQCSQIKKMHAEVNGLCASAAYWLASATGDVRATASSSVGSIGVIYTHHDLSKLYESLGVMTTYITAGKFKAVGAPKPLTEEDRAVLQESVDHIYTAFKMAVAQNMHLDIEESDQWAEGRLFFGDQAKEHGLITQLITTAPQTAEGGIMAETNEQPQEADVQKQIADAVAQTKTDCVAIACTVLGKDQGEQLRKAIASGMTAEQLQCAKALFGAPKVEEKKEEEKAVIDQEKIKAEVLAMLEGAHPVAAMKVKTEEEERKAYIEGIGKYGRAQ